MEQSKAGGDGCRSIFDSHVKLRSVLGICSCKKRALGREFSSVLVLVLVLVLHTSGGAPPPWMPLLILPWMALLQFRERCRGMPRYFPGVSEGGGGGKEGRKEEELPSLGSSQE